MPGEPKTQMRTAVLASGTGSILDAMLDEGVPIEVVILDRPCGAAAVAQRHNVPCEMLERVSFGEDFDRYAYTDQVIASLRAHSVDLVIMAGYGTIFAQQMFAAFGGRIVNTHPALLPAFKGWHAVRDALAAGVKVTGCTVHVATAEVDAGPILAQEAVRVEEGDTEQTLHERIKQVERKLYVNTVKDIVDRGFVL